MLLDLSTAYHMNRELVTYLADFRGVEVLTVGVDFPGNKQPPVGTLPPSMVRLPALIAAGMFRLPPILAADVCDG